MKIISLAAVLVTGAISSFGLGAVTTHALVKNANKWADVIVVRDGAMVADPSLLTPAELAQSQIISKRPRWIGFGCGEANVVVTWDRSLPTGGEGMCRDVKSYDLAISDAI